MLAFIRRHPVGTGAGTLLAIAGVAWLAFGFFGVHTLFLDDIVDESGPVFEAEPVAIASESSAVAAEPAVTNPPAGVAGSTAEPAEPAEQAVEPPAEPSTDTTVGATDAAVEPEAAPPEIVTEYEGVFESDAHPTAGNAVVLGNGTGQRFLRLDGFETDNGPDLNVYLVNSSIGDVSDYIDLGDLKGNIGDQNYEIPEGADLDVYDEVVIWCVRFGVGFGDAQLMPT